MNALIWGVTGQDGSYLAELLLGRGYYVVGVKRRTSTNTCYNIQSILTNSRFKLIEGDITDSCSVSGILNDYQPEECYVLAAQSHVHSSFTQPYYTFNVNATGPLNVFESVRNYSKHTKVYFASTSECWGSNYSIDSDGVKYQDEQTPFSPNSPYAVAKVAATNMAQLYSRAYGLFISIGMLHNHESPKRGEEFVTQKVAMWIAKNHTKISSGYKFSDEEKLHLGNLDAVRDWGYAPEYVDAMTRILQHNKPDMFVISTGIGHSIRQLLEHAFGFINCDYNDYIYIDPKFYRPCDVPYLQGRSTKAKNILGWTPTISFQQLVSIMVTHAIQKEKNTSICQKS